MALPFSTSIFGHPHHNNVSCRIVSCPNLYIFASPYFHPHKIFIFTYISMDVNGPSLFRFLPFATPHHDNVSYRIVSYHIVPYHVPICMSSHRHTSTPHIHCVVHIPIVIKQTLEDPKVARVSNNTLNMLNGVHILPSSRCETNLHFAKLIVIRDYSPVLLPSSI